jgi:hypothetical protein
VGVSLSRPALQVNTILKVALQLVGLGLVFLGPTLAEASAMAVLALVAARAASFVGEHE